MNGRALPCWVFLAVAAASIAAGCAARREPRVPVDQVRTTVTVEEPPSSLPIVPPPDGVWTRRVNPPLYFETILPRYPGAAEAARLPLVEVRVDFLVGRDGVPRNLTAEVVGGGELTDVFADVSIAAAWQWRFSPAWRLATDPLAPDPIDTLDYRARLVFRFDLDVYQAGGTVGVDFTE